MARIIYNVCSRFKITNNIFSVEQQSELLEKIETYEQGSRYRHEAAERRLESVMAFERQSDWQAVDIGSFNGVESPEERFLNFFH